MVLYKINDLGISASLETANPEVLLKLKELDLDEVRLAAEDRASARDRQACTGDHMPAVIAAGALLRFFGILGALLVSARF